MGNTKRNARAGVEDRWHRSPKPSENPPYAAETGTVAGSWCVDSKHATPGTLVCTTRHGSGMRWLARWVDHGGQERTQSFPRKTDALRHVEGIVTTLGTGTYADPQRSAATFGEMAEAWLSKKEGARRAPKTIAGYRGLLKVVIYPKWKDQKLRDISHERLQGWFTFLATDPAARKHKRSDDEKAGLSPARVIQAHQVMHQVFVHAIRAKHVAVNPAEYIELPRRESREQIALTHAQVRKLAVESGEVGPMVTFLAYTGLRFGECIALRVRDVDVEARTVRVSRSITYVTGTGWSEGPTKTHQTRVVPILTDELAQTLNRVVNGRSAGEYLFPGPDGEPMTIGWFRVRFDRATKKLALEGVTPHTLRHTAGSLGLDEGGTVPEVQALLGHRNATTTLNVYSHKVGDFGRLAARMNAAVSSPDDD